MYINSKYSFDASEGELIARFTAFMVAIVNSAKIDYIRRQRHWKWELPVDNLPEQNATLMEHQRWLDVIPDNEFCFEDERVNQAISNLSSAQQHILQLSFIEALPAQEIANRMGRNVFFIYNQKRSALQRLREMLLDEGEKDD